MAPQAGKQVFSTVDQVIAQYCPEQAKAPAAGSKSIVETALERVLGAGGTTTALANLRNGAAGSGAAALGQLGQNLGQGRLGNLANGGLAGAASSVGSGSYITQIMDAIKNAPAVKAMEGLLGGSGRK